MAKDMITSIAPLEPQSLSTRVMRELERMILNEELAPGSRINEKAIADRLQISRSPIREAFRRLEQAGLVEMQINRGVFVRKINYQRANELTDIRCSLYRLAGRLAAANISKEQLDYLRLYAERMEGALRQFDPDRYSVLNDEFHRILIEASGSQRLREILEGIEKELSLARHLSRHARGRDAHKELSQSIAEHKAIIFALTAGDVVQSAEEMESHAYRGKQQVLAFFGKN